MNRNEFIIATAIILFAAFLLGWFASWVVHRLGRSIRCKTGRTDGPADRPGDIAQAGRYMGGAGRLGHAAPWLAQRDPEPTQLSHLSPQGEIGPGVGRLLPLPMPFKAALFDQKSVCALAQRVVLLVERHRLHPLVRCQAQTWQ